jgi:hypothetical protein
MWFHMNTVYGGRVSLLDIEDVVNDVVDDVASCLSGGCMEGGHVSHLELDEVVGDVVDDVAIHFNKSLPCIDRTRRSTPGTC